MPVLVIAFVLLFFFGLLLFFIAPNNKAREDIHIFEQQYIAHRGLFDTNGKAPENTLPAFSLAIENHYGIELDVQMTKDNKLVVFHDEDLNRMCGVDKKLIDCSFEELQEYSIGSSDEHIPLFDDVLSLIQGKAPLIVEIKSYGNWKETTRRTALRLDDYNGKYCIESFHPFVVHWYKKNRPSVIRGQLSSNGFKYDLDLSITEKFLLTNLLLNFLARPDFIAYEHKYANNFCYTVCRKLFKVTNAAWTIRSQDDLEKAKKIFSVIIFDSFIPNN